MRKITLILICLIFFVCTSEKPPTNNKLSMKQAFDEMHKWEKIDQENKINFRITNNS